MRSEVEGGLIVAIQVERKKNFIIWKRTCGLIARHMGLMPGTGLLLGTVLLLGTGLFIG